MVSKIKEILDGQNSRRQSDNIENLLDLEDATCMVKFVKETKGLRSKDDVCTWSKGGSMTV